MTTPLSKRSMYFFFKSLDEEFYEKPNYCCHECGQSDDKQLQISLHLTASAVMFTRCRLIFLGLIVWIYWSEWFYCIYVPVKLKFAQPCKILSLFFALFPTNFGVIHRIVTKQFLYTQSYVRTDDVKNITRGNESCFAWFNSRPTLFRLLLTNGPGKGLNRSSSNYGWNRNADDAL